MTLLEIESGLVKGLGFYRPSFKDDLREDAVDEFRNRANIAQVRVSVSTPTLSIPLLINVPKKHGMSTLFNPSANVFAQFEELRKTPEYKAMVASTLDMWARWNKAEASAKAAGVDLSAYINKEIEKGGRK